jgi:hypothetical protein
VKIARERAVGSVEVFIGPLATRQVPDGSGGTKTIHEPPAVGTIAGASSRSRDMAGSKYRPRRTARSR